MGVGVRLSNQSVSAIVFKQQETLSLVGIEIFVPRFATGPAVVNLGPRGMSIIDMKISCEGTTPRTAISTGASLYLRDFYVQGCSTVINQTSAPILRGAAVPDWLHVSTYAKGAGGNPGYVTDVLYPDGQRAPGGLLSLSTILPAGTEPPHDLLTKHVWVEESFSDMGAPGVANAKSDCGAKGDGLHDDTVALQACLTSHTAVFLPPGLYRISATLDIPAGGSLVGMNNAVSVLLAASTGFSKATSASSPQPMLRTADDSETSHKPTTIAFIGVVTWQHLAYVSTLDWRTRHPLSIWRSNFESRNCECLWLSAYQQRSPTVVPCLLPVNITTPKSVFRGLGRVYGFVNDE